MTKLNIKRPIERSLDGTDAWKSIIVDRIQRGKALPFISKSVTNDLVFGSYQDFLEAWADWVEFPHKGKIDYRLSQIAQFENVMHPVGPGSIVDVFRVKEIFLKFQKAALLTLADERLVSELENELNDLSPAEVFARLNYPNFEDGKKNPLLLLAALPLPIYLTTSYDTLLEAALKRARKEPYTEICYWRRELRAIPSVFEREPDYQPSKETPLVYHLHGLDQYPSSLVLTEDDHLDFLAAISRDEDVIPVRVKQGLTDSSLLLLGYRLQSWEFRILFSGVIKPRIQQLQKINISIQLVPDEAERRYLQNYLTQAKFIVYWGALTTFLQAIWNELER